MDGFYPQGTSEGGMTSSQSKNSKNVEALVVYVYPRGFIIEPIKATQIPTRLVIDRQTGRFSEQDPDTPLPEGVEKKLLFSAFLGNITIQDRVYLLFASEVIPICKIEKKHSVFSLSQLMFIPYKNEQENMSASQQSSNPTSHINNIKKLLTKGYYFSYTYDLSVAKERQQQQAVPDSNYAWNCNMLSDLARYNIGTSWFVPIIQGFVGSISTFIGKRPIELFLITRRSCRKGGTRYNSRGLDDAGNTANFCETEQIVYYGGFCCSFVLLRGSAPIFWQQRGMTAQTKITRSFELTNQAFLKHVGFLRDTYGKVLCINLMAKGKASEQMITEAFETHLRANGLNSVRYKFFDFHSACRGNKFFNVNPLVEEIQPILQNFKFHVQEMSSGKHLMKQEGVVRVNCLDCLDRTNVLSTKIGAAVFEEMMLRLGLDTKSLIFGQSLLTMLDLDTTKQPLHPFITEFKHRWADNGDLISWHYAGTGSVMTSVTRSGRETIFGKLDHSMKSVTRFYVGNFEDSGKQEAIDIVLGEHTDHVNVFGEEFEAAIKKRESEFSSYSTVKIFLATWNVGGYDPQPDYDISALFSNIGGQGSPDIIVLGLQEFVNLSAMNIVATGPNTNLIGKWTNIAANALRRIDNYTFIRAISLVGVLLLVFAKESIHPRIRGIDTDIIKTGVGGTLGNKGGVVVKFFIDDSSLAFINCHLEAGDGKVNARLQNIIDIHEKAFQAGGVGRKREEKIMNMDYKFLLGDMNFRLTIPSQDVRDMIDEYISMRRDDNDAGALALMKKLLQSDQLFQSSRSNEFLEKYREGPITFLPTYKFDPNSNTYDTSKKQRTPSWTDRVLFSCDFQKINQIFYNRKDIRESDHRPVVAMFDVDVKRIDPVKKDRISKEIYETDTTLKQTAFEEDKRAHMTEDDRLDVEEGEENSPEIRKGEMGKGYGYKDESDVRDFFGF